MLLTPELVNKRRPMCTVFVLLFFHKITMISEVSCDTDTSVYWLLKIQLCVTGINYIYIAIENVKYISVEKLFI